MPLFNNLREFYYDYELPLARALYDVSKRGLLVSSAEVIRLRSHIDVETFKTCEALATLVGKPVAPNAAEQKRLKSVGVDAINLGSTKQLIELLKQRGLKIPTSRQTGRDTTSEAKLFELYSKSGDEALNSVLRLRELNSVKQRFLDVELLDWVFYSDYIAAGTVTGRRSSRANIFGLGSNGQNIPKHSELGKLIRSCFVARPGKVFVSCDQRSAEDWLVQGIIADTCGDLTGINELRSGVNRHKKLAAFVFARPEAEIDKSSMFYYLGKRARHANNYGIRGAKLSYALASERILVPVQHCDFILDKVNQFEPNIRMVFQKYVETTLTKCRTLTTPIGRKRQFFGLRPYTDNSETFREAYAYVPQSTVGDNTGLALVAYERARPGEVVGESHDSLLGEVDDNPQTIYNVLGAMSVAFSRTLTFPNGFTLEIPIEYEVGTSLGNMTTVTPDEVLAQCHAC